MGGKGEGLRGMGDKRKEKWEEMGDGEVREKG